MRPMLRRTTTRLAFIAGTVMLAGCMQAAAPGPKRAEAGGRELDWPALGGDEVKRVGGGEQDVVVIVALQKYAELPEVAGARDSANDWYDYFTRGLGVPRERVTLLSKATAARMEVAVKAAAKQAKSGSGRLWFVFIGHGAPFQHEAGGRGPVEDGLLVDYHAEVGALSGLRHSTLMAAMEPAAHGGKQPVAIL